MAAPRNRIAARDTRVRGLGAPTPEDIAAHTERVRAHEKAAAPAPEVPFDQVLSAQAAKKPEQQAASSAPGEAAAAPAGPAPTEHKPLPPWHGGRLIRG